MALLLSKHFTEKCEKFADRWSLVSFVGGARQKQQFQHMYITWLLLYYTVGIWRWWWWWWVNKISVLITHFTPCSSTTNPFKKHTTQHNFHIQISWRPNANCDLMIWSHIQNWDLWDWKRGISDRIKRSYYYYYIILLCFYEGVVALPACLPGCGAAVSLNPQNERTGPFHGAADDDCVAVYYSTANGVWLLPGLVDLT